MVFLYPLTIDNLPISCIVWVCKHFLINWGPNKWWPPSWMILAVHFFKEGYIILHHISCSYYIHMCADAHPQIHRISPNFNYEMLVPIPIEHPEMCSLHLWRGPRSMRWNHQQTLWCQSNHQLCEFWTFFGLKKTQHGKSMEKNPNNIKFYLLLHDFHINKKNLMNWTPRCRKE